MIRKDVKSSEFQGKGRGGTVEVDTSTVELRGNVDDVNLIIQGLHLLALEKKKLELMDGAAQGVSLVEQLLESIETPNFATSEAPAPV